MQTRGPADMPPPSKATVQSNRNFLGRGRGGVGCGHKLNTKTGSLRSWWLSTDGTVTNREDLDQNLSEPADACEKL